MRLCRQGRDLDGVAEVLKSGDEILGLRGFGTTIEVVRAQVLIAGAVLEHVVDGGEDRSSDGADGLFGASPGTDAVELGLDVAALFARGSP